MLKAGARKLQTGSACVNAVGWPGLRSTKLCWRNVRKHYGHEQSPLPPLSWPPSPPPPSPLSSPLPPPVVTVARPISRLLTIATTQPEATNTANHMKRRTIKLPVGYPSKNSRLQFAPSLCQASLLSSAKLRSSSLPDRQIALVKTQ
jgi:hypothetical protein